MSDLVLNSLAVQSKADLSDKNVHKDTFKNSNLLSADLLKTAEIRMQQKGMLPGGPNPTHNPLWFLVETEKNVFLWRSGHSIEEKQQFEFWVDFEGLIDKRLAQLERPDFKDPLQFAFSEFDLESTPRKDEIEYLKSLKENFEPILAHLAALSEVQSELLEEGMQQKFARVVIPKVKEK